MCQKMKSHLEITFSGFFGEKGIYFHGDLVTGTLNLETLQHLNITAVRITFKGQAFVHWTEQKVQGGGEPRYKDVHHYSSSEDYFEHSIVLYGKGSTNKPGKCFLAAGMYSYQFQYQLPPSLPSSFEGDHGYIRYWVRATVEKERDFLCVTKKPFTVVSPLDLNDLQSLKSPLQETKEKNLCCLCCLSGPISAMLCVAKRGFVPGEPIRFGAEISNMSSRKIDCSSVELKMTSIYKTLKKTRCVTKQLAKLKRSSVRKGDTDVWMCDQLVVPPVPPSYLHGCGIIGVRYTLELRVDPVGPAFDLYIPINVVIGTIPLKHTNHNYANINIQPASHYANVNQSNLPQGATFHGGGRQPVGVPVLPVHGSLSINPAYPSNLPSQTSGSHPGSSSQGSTGQQRPSSRSSSAPSTVSSVSHGRGSVIFTESAFGPRNIRFEDDNQHRDGTVKFAPYYPYYFMGNR